MSKVTYIIKASENVLNEKTAAILIKVAKGNFITSAELREELVETMNASSVNSNIGVLIKKGLIEKSGDVSQFIVVIDENGKLNDKFTKASDLIKHFVEVRKTFVEKRIEHKLNEVKEQLTLAVAKAQFIKDVVDGKIVIQGKTRKALVSELEKVDLFKAHVEKLVSMNIYHITSDEAKKLIEAAKDLKKEYKYWQETTPEAEFIKDLEELCE